MGPNLKSSPVGFLLSFSLVVQFILFAASAEAAPWVSGLGGAQDLGLAQSHGEQACRLGHALACESLADLIREGVGGKPDPVKAKLIDEQAVKQRHDHCVQGLYQDCDRLAKRFEGGSRGSKDPGRSLRYRQMGEAAKERACKADNGEACHLLGEAIRNSRPSRPNALRALALFEKACRLGEPMGCHDAALMHHGEAGLPLDSSKIKAFYRKSCELGIQPDCRYAR